MKLVVALIVLIAATPLLALAVARPGRTIVPVYAAFVPAGSAFALSVPLPSPFNTLSSLLGGLALAACAVHVVVRRRANIPGLAVAAWIVFLTWCVATLLWSQEPGVTFRELIVAVPLVLLLVVIAIVPFDTSDVDVMRVAIIVGGAAVGAYALFLIATGRSLPNHGLGQRFSITTNPNATNPNQLAAALLLPLVLSLHLILRPIPRLSQLGSRILGVASLILISGGIVLSGSRGGVIAALIGVVGLIVLTLQWQPTLSRTVGATIAAVFVGVIGVSVVFAAATASSGFVDRFLTSYAVQRIVGNTTGASGRTEIWTAGLLACRTTCTVGSGLGTFPDVYSNVYAFSDVNRNVGLGRPGHDVYLSIAVEAGLVGLALFLLAMLAEWGTIKRTALAPALGGVILALLVADVFEGFIWFKFFWLPFIVAEMSADATRRMRAPAVVTPVVAEARPPALTAERR